MTTFSSLMFRRLLRYQPLISHRRGFQLPGAVLLLSTVATADAVEFKDYDYSRFSQTVTECDRLAAHGRDPGAVAPQVSRDEMDKPAAVAACLAAVDADPDNPRLNYQLGRVFGYSGRGEEAMPYRLKAVAADYPQSLFVIGYLHFNGMTIERDICRAQRLWRRAAQYRRLAALVALPRHAMRGAFADCELSIPPAELQAYLEEAASISSDFYVAMLVEDLRRELAGIASTANGTRHEH